MDTSRKGAKRPMLSSNRAVGLVKPSLLEPSRPEGPRKPPLPGLKTLPLIPIGMATAASSSGTGKLGLSHGLNWEHDRASCRTVALIQAQWGAGPVGDRGEVTSGARTGKAPGTVRPVWCQLRTRTPGTSTAPTLP